MLPLLVGLLLLYLLLLVCLHLFPALLMPAEPLVSSYVFVCVNARASAAAVTMCSQVCVCMCGSYVRMPWDFASRSINQRIRASTSAQPGRCEENVAEASASAQINEANHGTVVRFAFAVLSCLCRSHLQRAWLEACLGTV